ncbi:MAG: TrkA family potassium uptake protein, partial [Clostridia bacterium]|nr:TrkA family potassium uptake protein [Clostridia bacterium]
MKKKSILLIGIGRFGKHLAIKLNELGHEVMAVDSEEEKINEIVNIVTDAQIGDTTNEGFLKSLDIKSYDVCIVTISGDFQSSLETTCLLKDLGAKKVVSRAEKDRQANLLIRNGADEIIYPEKQLANW